MVLGMGAARTIWHFGGSGIVAHDPEIAVRFTLQVGIDGGSVAAA
jgi:hypothetical protein